MRRNGFSLLELLVVVALIALCAAISQPATRHMMQGAQLTQAGRQVLDHLDLARQTAISHNRNVEVHLVKMADPSLPGEKVEAPSTWRYRALQSFEILDSGERKPLGNLQRLPGSMLISSGQAHSSLIGLAGSTTTPTEHSGQALGHSLGAVGTSYQSVSFHFTPDGATTLPFTGPRWFLTIHARSLGDALSELPNNFITLQVDPHNGQVRAFRR